MNSSPRFQITRNGKTGSLMMVSEPEHGFRLRFAVGMDLYCLQDIYIVFGRWPDAIDFVNEYSPRTIGWARGSVQVRWLLQLHSDLTAVANRCSTDFQGFERSQCGQIPLAGLVWGRRARYFPDVPGSAFKRLIKPDATPVDHPITQHLDHSHRRLSQSALKRSHHLRRHLLPVYHDVWIRLLFYILPVGSRFWWLQQMNPTAIMCPHPGCTAVETYVHRFLECTPSKTLWDCVWADWEQFFACDLTWSRVICTPTPPASSPWHDHRDTIDVLWHMMRLIVLRVLWIDRNKIVFEAATPRSPVALCIEAHVMFAAHFRALLRRSNEDEISSIDHVLRALLHTSTFGSFFELRRDLLAVRRLTGSTLKTLRSSLSEV